MKKIDMGDESVKSRDLALNVQKKILGTMASKNFSKVLIDDKTAEILDEFSKILRSYSCKKNAEKLQRDLIKIMIKIAVLQRNDRFSQQEKLYAAKLQSMTKNTLMTVVSFYEVDFTFDKYVLSNQINELRRLMHQLVSGHLKEKSKSRINSVFDQLGDTKFLSALFEGEDLRPSLKILVQHINGLMEDGVL